MKPTTAVKTAPRASAGAKVFDVAHPGKSKPSASGRPIIVSNRPILQDPMVSGNVPASDVAPAEPKQSPAAIKITLKPIDESVEAVAPLADEQSGKSDKTIAELAVEKAAEKAEKTEETTGPELSTESNKLAPSESEGPAADTGESTDTTTSEAESAEQPISNDTVGDDDESKSSDDTVPADPASKDAKEAAALEAIAKKQEEITSLTESREYFLPINAVERHRSKVVAIFGVVLIVVLGALLVDLLLDVGMIRISGVHSLTHFFSA